MNKSNWLILGGITFVWVIGAAGFYYSTKNLEIIFLAINAFAVLVATYISALNSIKNSIIKEKEIKFTIIENSFEYFKIWDSDSLKEARDFTREIKYEQPNLTPDELHERVSQNKELERSVITIFNFFEGIYLSLEHKRLDEDIMRQGFSEIYPDLWIRFSPWLNKDLKIHEPNMYLELEQLYKRWV